MLMLTALIFIQYGYPGPPMWSRNPDDYRRPRPMYRLPPPISPCIQYGECRGYRPRLPPYEGPRRNYDLYGDA